MLVEWIKSTGYSLDSGMEFKSWIEQYGLAEERVFIKMTNVRHSKDKRFAVFKYNMYQLLPRAWDLFGGRLRECRGIVIDLQKMVEAIHPFDKFFELDQAPETQTAIVLDRVANAKQVEFTEKLDGSLVSLRYYDGQILAASMGGIDSPMLETMTERYLTDEIKRMIVSHPELTFIFEYLETDNVHIVQYPTNKLGLYLLSARDMNTGRLFSYTEAGELAAAFEVPSVPILRTTFEEQVQELQNQSGLEREGCVVNIDGLLVKLKTENWKLLHKLLTAVSANDIVRLIDTGEYENLPAIVKNAYEPYRQNIQAYTDYVREVVEQIVQNGPTDRREFYEIYLRTVDYLYGKYAACEFSHKDWSPLRTNTKGDPSYISYAAILDWKRTQEESMTPPKLPCNLDGVSLPNI